MNKALTLSIVLVALLGVALADFQVERANFDKAPVNVLNRTDRDFSNPILTRYINGSRIVIWGIQEDDDQNPTVYSATRRYINATTLEKLGNDTFINLNLASYEAPIFAYSSNGYVAAATTSRTVTVNTTFNATTNTTTNVTKSAIDVYVNVFRSDIQNGTQVRTVRVTSNNGNFTYSLQKLWFQDDYFYVVYTVVEEDTDRAVFIQGVAARDAEYFRFERPLQISTTPLSGESYVQCSQIGKRDEVLCAWRQETQGKVATVRVELNDATVQQEVIVATDAGNKRFMPEKVLSTRDYYVILLSQVANGIATQFTIKVSNNETALNLGFQLDNAFTGVNVVDADDYFDNWFILTRTYKNVAGIATDSEEAIRIYNSTGGAVSTSRPLVEEGKILQTLTLADQSYYVLVADNVRGNFERAYLGRVFNRTSNTTFGTVLKTVFFGALAIVGLLFAF